MNKRLFQNMTKRVRTKGEQKDFNKRRRLGPTKEDDINVFGLTHEDVLGGLLSGWLRPGAPPKSCSSDNWKNGLQFIYFTDNDENLAYW